MSDAQKSTVPGYAPELTAYHRAHSGELRRMIWDLPLKPGDRVLDLACGDGAYSKWLAERVGPQGLVVGADLSRGYLRHALNEQEVGGPRFVATLAERLPFADNSFDLVWCAQSFVSLPSPLAALREMRRVVRPQGFIAAMENDALHQVILPWPADLELAVRQAELLAYRASPGEAGKCYMGRRLGRLLRSVGLAHVRRKTYTTDRAAPLAPAELTLVEHHLETLAEFVRPFLREPYWRQFSQLADSSVPSFIGRQEGFEMTWLDVVCCGQKPLASTRSARRTRGGTLVARGSLQK